MEVKCDICGKVIPKSNTNTRIINGVKYTLCGKHYQQYIRFGKIIDSDPNSVIYDNTYGVLDDVAIVHTFKRGAGEYNGSFLIDLDDLDLVKQKHWRFYRNNFYTGNVDPICISRFLFGMGHCDNRVVDHINGDRSDNRRSNLRIVDQAQNCMNKALLSTNTSGICGLSWDRDRNRWAVEIHCSYKRVHLSRYVDIHDACFVRYVAEILVFGEYRSWRNDDIVIPNALQCERKQELYEYVVDKIEAAGMNLQIIPTEWDLFYENYLYSDTNYAERIS